MKTTLLISTVLVGLLVACTTTAVSTPTLSTALSPSTNTPNLVSQTTKPAGLTASSGNELNNPGFEDPFIDVSEPGVSGQIAQGWFDNTSWASGINIQYERDDIEKHSGNTSQKITVHAGFVQFVQSIPFQEGRTEATIWMKAESPMWVALYLRGTDYVVYGSTTTHLTTEWQQITINALTPNDIEGGLFINSARTGTFWLDDASLMFLGNVPPLPQTLQPPSGNIPLSYFGLHPGQLFESPFIPWPAVPFGTARSHDSYVTWALIEPNPPVNGERFFDWSNLDQFVAEAEARNQRIVFTIYQTPWWAASSSDPDPYGMPGGASNPQDIASYAGFVSALATRYQGRIAAYEVWNEPDIAFWTGTVEQMVALENACAEAVHNADPQALVIAPPPSGGGMYLHPLDWYEQYLSAGGGQASDILAAHFYSDEPEQDIAKFHLFQNLITEYGLGDKPIWNDESGVGYDGSGSSAEVVDYVGRVYVLNWALGLDMFAWYRWSDVSWVGVRQDGQGNWVELTEGAVAYEQVQAWLMGAQMLSASSDEQGVWTAVLRRGDGSFSHITWVTNGTTIIPVPAGAYRMRDLAGGETPLNGQTTLPITTTPIIIDITAGNTAVFIPFVAR